MERQGQPHSRAFPWPEFITVSLVGWAGWYSGYFETMWFLIRSLLKLSQHY